MKNLTPKIDFKMNNYAARNLPVISNITLAKIQSALKNPFLTELTVSLDLNLSQEIILLNNSVNSFQIPSGEEISFPNLFKMKEKICYAIFENQIHPMKFYNQKTQYYYKLVPTSFRPILRVSATQMHKKSFLDYIENLKLKGLVLDGGTGLGYSAIIASLTAKFVYTIEWDLNILDIATFNPHSRHLFDASNIEIRQTDITENILLFEDEFFNVAIQDGGSTKSSGRFFSQAHCYELYRTLKTGGKLLIYLPRKGITKGRDFGNEHLNRLYKAGFILKKRDIQGSFAHLIKK